MWYLSKNQSRALEKLSRDLIAKNGWIDQFAVTNRVLSEYYAQLSKWTLGKPDRYALRKEMVDTLVVLQHPINFLSISEQELSDVALVGVGEKEAKIPRTYRRAAEIKDYVPTNGLQSELAAMADAVLDYQRQTKGHEKGTKIQIYLAMEELLELMRELSRHVRFQDTKNTTDCKEKKLADNRTNIVEEIFDVLYTMRYVMIVQKINPKQINQLAALRIKDVRDREMGS